MKVEYYSQDIIMNFGMALFFLVFLFIFLVLVFYILVKFQKKRDYEFAPNISIIIPAYNEEANIKNTLQAIISSNYDQKKLQILVVDDGSTDRTKQIVSEFRQVTLIKGTHKGKSNALNLALKKCKHEYIITIDADTIIDSEFIKNIIKPFKDKKVGATNGIAKINQPKKIIEYFQNTEFFFNNLIRTSFSKMFNNGIWFFGAAACFRKSILDELNGFSTKVLTEDMDISLRIFKNNFQVLTVEDASYYTKACKNTSELFGQRMRWFFGGLQNTFIHRNLFLKKGFAIKYLFANQLFWTIFSILAIPIIIYEVNFWWPANSIEIIGYLFRWFSLAGPFYVVYKIPEWGLNFINIFGVMAGFLTTLLILASLYEFKFKTKLFGFIKTTITIFFYFPYTILLNLILVSSLIKYGLSKTKFFIK